MRGSDGGGGGGGGGIEICSMFGLGVRKERV